MIFLNVDNSVNIKTRLFRCCVLTLDIIMEETMNEIFLLGPSFCSMMCRKLFLQLNKIFCNFCH